jgi:hypothetical protein
MDGICVRQLRDRWACRHPIDVLADLRHVVPMLHSGRGALGQPIVAGTLQKILSAWARFELRERGTYWQAMSGATEPRPT